jgi:hypothetical protein
MCDKARHFCKKYTPFAFVAKTPRHCARQIIEFQCFINKVSKLRVQAHVVSIMLEGHKKGLETADGALETKQ